jgi:hypothetical protein
VTLWITGSEFWIPGRRKSRRGEGLKKGQEKINKDERAFKVGHAIQLLFENFMHSKLDVMRDQVRWHPLFGPHF